MSQLEPRYHYAPFQEVNSAFLLGKLLAGRAPQTFLVRSNRVSWEQMANNNRVFIGSLRFLGNCWMNHLSSVSLSMGTSCPLGFSEDGDVYAVITVGLGHRRPATS